MERKVYDCDRCDKKDVPVKRIHVDVDRRMDGAGSMEDWTENMDLCADCLVYALGTLIKPMTHELGRKFLDKIAGKNWQAFWPY